MKLNIAVTDSLKIAGWLKRGILLLSLGLAGLALTNCDLLGIPVTTWESSGEVNHDVAASELTDKKVKMAAFYFPDGEGRLTVAKTMVSNCVVVDNSSPAFTLNIDATDLSPNDGDRIFLYMWIEADASANDAYDGDAEKKCIVINASSDTVFATNSYASFVYYASRAGLENGWYYNSPGGTKEIGTLTGAILTNEVYF